MPRKRRLLTLLPLLAVLAAAVYAPAASASTSQTSIFQDDAGLLGSNAASVLSQIKSLGATEIRVSLTWANIATSSTQPSNPSSPASYSAAKWAPYDAIDKLAAADGIKLEFDILYPVPRYAQGKGAPKLAAGVPWKPNAADFGSFVKAVGTRYSGHYAGLPAVRAWSVWNEPNYGQSLAPETTDGGKVQVAADYYRQLIDHYYSALKSSGHGGDAILFGELAPHGYSNPGTINVAAPLTFIRGLYCLGSNFKPLTGSIAAADGCPTTKSASKKFRSQNPVLFSAKGFAAHLYAQGIAPNQTLQPSSCARFDKSDSADLGAVSKLTSTLDKVNRAYGSHTKFPIWNTEYGFQTNPPETPACNTRPVSQTTAALYINWAEYLSYKNSRIASYDQYLLTDPPAGDFASGLEFSNGTHKADYAAYQVPMFMPTTSAKSASTLEVWGGARASRFGGTSRVFVAFKPTNSPTVTYYPETLKNGYFDAHIKFTQSGTVSVIWQGAATPEISRSQAVTIG